MRGKLLTIQSGCGVRDSLNGMRVCACSRSLRCSRFRDAYGAVCACALCCSRIALTYTKRTEQTKLRQTSKPSCVCHVVAAGALCGDGQHLCDRPADPPALRHQGQHRGTHRGRRGTIKVRRQLEAGRSLTHLRTPLNGSLAHALLSTRTALTNSISNPPAHHVL